MDLAGRHSKRGGGLEKPLVDKVNVEVECDQGETRVGPGAVGQPTWG